MAEKRKYRRLPLILTLDVSSLFNQDEELQIDTATFNVFNISKSGIGFTSTSVLPLGYYFNATIQFDGSDDLLKYVVKIIRTEELEAGEHLYGCEFVGLASIYDYLFEQYESHIDGQPPM